MRASLVPLVFLLACDSTPRMGGRTQPPPAVRAEPAHWQGVRVLAVCPPENWTHDLKLDHTNWFRAVIMSYLRARGWEFVPQAVVNRSLVRWKFTMAGELGLFKPAELCAEWKCDAVVFWDILKEGELGFACVKADGTLLWASGPRRLHPDYNIVGSTDCSDDHRKMSIAICECLRDFPARLP